MSIAVAEPKEAAPAPVPAEPAAPAAEKPDPAPQKSIEELNAEFDKEVLNDLEKVELPEPARIADELHAPSTKSGKEEPVPYERFKEVNEKYQQQQAANEAAIQELTALKALVESYKNLGSPDELAKKLAPPAPDPMAGLTDDEIANVLEAKEFLFGKVAPELKDVLTMSKKVDDLLKRLDGQQKAAQAQEAERQKAEEAMALKQEQAGEAEIVKLATDAGFDMTDADSREFILGGVINKILRDQELSARFYKQKDLNVIREVTEKILKPLGGKFARKEKAALFAQKKGQESLPKPPIPGGAPGGLEPEDTSRLSDEQFNRVVLAELSR